MWLNIVGRIANNVRYLNPDFRGLLNTRFSMATLKNESTFKVQHDHVNKVFFIDLGEGNRAVLEYQQLGPNALNLYHTEVPDSFKGKGIAKILAKAALDYVVKNDFQMKLTCWYLSDYVKKSPLPEYTCRLL